MRPASALEGAEYNQRLRGELKFKPRAELEDARRKSIGYPTKARVVDIKDTAELAERSVRRAGRQQKVCAV